MSGTVARLHDTSNRLVVLRNGQSIVVDGREFIMMVGENRGYYCCASRSASRMLDGLQTCGVGSGQKNRVTFHIQDVPLWLCPNHMQQYIDELRDKRDPLNVAMDALVGGD